MTWAFALIGCSSHALKTDASVQQADAASDAAAPGSGGASGIGGAGGNAGTAGAAPAAGGQTGVSDAGGFDADAGDERAFDADAGGFDADAGGADTQPHIVIPCNVDCPGGPCAARGGNPTVIASSAPGDHVGGLAVGSGVLYYGTLAKDARTGGQLRRVTLTTGVDLLVVDGVQVSRIQLDSAGSVYYIVNAIQSTAVRLFVVDPTGAPLVVTSNDYAIPAFVARPDSLVVATTFPGGGRIWQSSTMQGFLVQNLTEEPSGLAVADHGVDRAFYWTSGTGPSHLTWTDGQQISLGKNGTVLTTASDTLAGPIVDGSNLYFIHLHPPGDCQGSVMVIPASGGAPAVVSAGNSGSDVSSFAVDTGFVYWTTPDAGGLVFRAAKGGSMPEVIASAQPEARAVAVDATRVYWIAAGPHGDEVRAIAK